MTMPRTRGRAAGWRRGRGLLGPLDPLIGAWATTTDSPRGPVRVERSFARVHGGRWVRLEVLWAFTEGAYEETAMFGRRPDGTLGFWSFTSDGKHSEGWLVEAPDLPAEAVAFEADVPAGRARMAYWPAPSVEGDDPDDGAGFVWVVEARTKHGWSRFTEHRYVPLAG
jgi:hypothetical protein